MVKRWSVGVGTSESIPSSACTDLAIFLPTEYLVR